MTWTDTDSNCMLCDMEKKTRWYYEDDIVVVADTLGPGAHPFVVLKEHKQDTTERERAYIEGVVSALFKRQDFVLDVRMGMVPDHFHVHVVFEDEEVDLSDE